MDEEGASSALAFIVAGALFLAAVVTLLTTVEKEVPSEEDVATGYHAHAEAILSLLVESEGIGWSSASQNWTGTYRPSLVEQVRVLDDARIDKLDCRDGGDCLPYADVVTSLGLGSLNLNITVTDANGTVLAYFGPPAPTESAQQASDAATVPVRHETLGAEHTVRVQVFS